MVQDALTSLLTTGLRLGPAALRRQRISESGEDFHLLVLGSLGGMPDQMILFFRRPEIAGNSVSE